MSVYAICTQQVVTLGKDHSIEEAAVLMRNRHVGDICIVDETFRPLGILTDRDIVVKVLAQDIKLNEIAIGDVMSYDLLTVSQSATVQECLTQMHEKGVRRAPVVNDSQELVGIITVDDLFKLITDELHQMAALIQAEQENERDVIRTVLQKALSPA